MLPVPPLTEPRLNCPLRNRYDGPLGHCIGPHHDHAEDLVEGTPIVTVSFGEERVFPAPDGPVFVMPYDTDLAWKHEVPKSARCRGRRISVTLRAFEG